MSKNGTRSRVHLLDELRGLFIILMVFFHAFYLLGWEFKIDLFVQAFDFFRPVQPFFAGCFIFICGISCNFSHNNGKRGLILAGIAMLVSLVMWCATFWRLLNPGSEIWFGILHCLAVCILLFDVLQPKLNRVPALVGLLVCAVLFVLCYHVPAAPVDLGQYFGLKGVFTLDVPMAARDHPLLYPLGLCPISSTTDYFPLLPWFFCFLGGTFVGRWTFPKWTLRSRFPWLSFLGKHTLIIYVLHQPILYGICEVLGWIFK